MSTCPHATLLNIANFSEGTPREEIARRRQAGERIRWQADEYSQGGHWLVLQRDDIDTVLRSPADFSNNFSPLLEDFPPDVLAMNQESMTFMDPPRHRQYRSLVDTAFRAGDLAEREPLIRRLVTEVVDSLIDRGECEFISEVALQTPMRTILTIMGVPESEYAKVADMVNALTLANDPEYADSRDQGFEASMQAYLYGMALAEDHRANTRDTLSMKLLNSEVNDEKLSDEQFAGFFVNLIVGGMETTRNMSGWLLYELLRHPEQMTLLQENPDRVPDAIEEILRYRNTVVYLARTATRDMEFLGEQIRKGQKVACVLGSGNRDEAYFDEPDRFDITRDRDHTRRNIRTFGGGPHFCIGMHQARLIMKLLFEQIVTRMDNIRMEAEPLHFQSNFMDGFKRMPIAFERR